jgi:hypothetical protein
MSTATSARGYKRPWLRIVNYERPNDELQLTSGGLIGALRAPSLSRRLQLNSVFDRPMKGVE